MEDMGLSLGLRKDFSSGERVFNICAGTRSRPIPTLYARCSSALAQQAEEVTERSSGRRFYIGLSFVLHVLLVPRSKLRVMQNVW